MDAADPTPTLTLPLKGRVPEQRIGDLVRRFTLLMLEDDIPQNTSLYELVIGAAEKPLIEAVLAIKRGNQSHAAIALGINRNTLRTKMRRHGIPL